ncbi:hypothetical protein EYD00_23935 (plasmid) [Agrobacterium sp. 33MFTa1.1]|uniref:hypothetical protein n=1 Tax=Agrobacterium sp. 33MFTa1.1 TaxID=1279031 RepID=UPI0005591F07|nr:hypothetical protein [Agrobacterium sp. 33MFTa1.1]QBJ16519.1 hypothetical protein EYD00_23935 [Agrobacterium sp. 33MFTa1.1]
MTKPDGTGADIRDGKDTLPEPEDIRLVLPPTVKSAKDEYLVEELLETSSVSDAPATGHFG